MAKPLPTDVVAPAPDKNPARVDFDLDEQEVKSVSGMKPGTVVQVTMVMNITDISMREPYETSGKKYVGHIAGEIIDVAIKKHSKNVFAELAQSDMAE